MVSGQAYNDAFGLFDFFTILGGDTSTSDPVYAEHLYFYDGFRQSTFVQLTDVFHLVEFYNKPEIKDTLMFSHSFVVSNGTTFEDALLFDDIFDVGYYAASRVINDNINLRSYFTYILIQPR